MTIKLFLSLYNEISGELVEQTPINDPQLEHKLISRWFKKEPIDCIDVDKDVENLLNQNYYRLSPKGEYVIERLSV